MLLSLDACNSQPRASGELVVQNSSNRLIARFVVFNDEAKEGRRMMNIVPGGLKGIYPFGLSLAGKCWVTIYWSDQDVIQGPMEFSKDEQQALISADNVIFDVLDHSSVVVSTRGNTDDKITKIAVIALKKAYPPK
jgi:hypothetical protein